jgi:hypothetical protein
MFQLRRLHRTAARISECIDIVVAIIAYGDSSDCNYQRKANA